MLDPRYGGAAPLLVQISVLQGIHIQQQRGQRRLELMGHSAYKEPLSSILDAIHGVLEKTPPELAADIMDRGIVMTGGGSMLHGMDRLIQENMGIDAFVADDAISCVAIGTGKYVEYMTQKY